MAYLVVERLEIMNIGGVVGVGVENDFALGLHGALDYVRYSCLQS